jgi:AcrR family transcriptional regulator
MHRLAKKKLFRMPRVIKHPDVRRSELLDQAFALFLSRGYDNASLNDVIAEAGISKGAFYHYFPSKEALLAALADRFARQTLAELEGVLNVPGLDPVTRLNAFLAKALRAKTDLAPAAWAVFGALFRPENRLLYQRIVIAWEALFRPVLTQMITEGVKAKVFRTFDPEGVADMIQQLASSTYPFVARAIGAVTDMEREEVLQAFHRRLRLHGIALDRILGLPDGTLRIPTLNQVRKLMATLARAVAPGA